MATATGHVVCPGLSVSGGKRNSLFNFNHTPFSSTLLPSNFRPFSSFSPNGVFSIGCLSTAMFFFCQQTRAPVVCMAQRKASRSSSKKKNKIIRVVSTVGTGFFYAMRKSRMMDKLELKKYDPKVKRHVVFRESK